MDIALALCGGGYRGIAHIGVIDALQNHGIRVLRQDYPEPAPGNEQAVKL